MMMVSLGIFGEFVPVGDWHGSAEEDHAAVPEEPVQEHLTRVIVVRFRLLQLPDLSQPAKLFKNKLELNDSEHGMV